MPALAKRRSLLDAVEDLIRQVSRLVGTVHAVLERYANLAEEVRAIRVQQLADQGAQRDYVEESSRHANRVRESIERLERLEILDRTGNAYGVEAQQIRREVKDEHIEQALRQELKQQVDNLAYARLRAARFGVNVPTDLVNEIAIYEEAITRIQQELSEAGR